MTVQAKEQLRQQGLLNEYPQTVFKIVKLYDDAGYDLPIGQFKPYVVKDIEVGEIIYKKDAWYKVGENFKYPAFAHYDEAIAREVVLNLCLNVAMVSCIAYQWTFVHRYLSFTYLFKDNLYEFWNSMSPYDEFLAGNGVATHLIPSSGAIAMYEFEIGDVIYG